MVRQLCDERGEGGLSLWRLLQLCVCSDQGWKESKEESEEAEQQEEAVSSDDKHTRGVRDRAVSERVRGWCGAGVDVSEGDDVEENEVSVE